MTNPSGINPQGDRVLIQVEEIDDLTAGGIAVPASVLKEHQNASMSGTLVAYGDDAWDDRQSMYAEIGDRVMFARHGGLKVMGMDGLDYRIMNDLDITATLDDGVELHDFARTEKRTSLGAA